VILNSQEAFYDGKEKKEASAQISINRHMMISCGPCGMLFKEPSLRILFL